MPEKPSAHPLVLIAAALIILAGLKWASPILIPVLLAAFVAILAIPIMRFLKGCKIPEGLAVLMVLLLLISLGVAVVSFFAGTVTAFYGDLPLYQQRLQQLLTQYDPWLHSFGLDLSNDTIKNLINPSQLMHTTTSVLYSLSDIMSNTLLIVLIIMFILLEASDFPSKLKAALGDNTQTLVHFKDISRSVQSYLMLKTLIGLVTSLVVWVFLYWLDVPYASLWAVLAFILNYIPTIGSIVAAIPAILLSLLMQDPMTAGLVAALYTAANILLGNVLEPRLMGNSLGISPLVVLLSLLFWGWLWGPIGMILCVPLTMVVKISLNANPTTQWLAILLGGKRKEG
ncbi:MAG: hypothetical protein RL217_1108 [Pseudomonadota bacterium]|jgi:predicted PurR-regulated permease PerM